MWLSLLQRRKRHGATSASDFWSFGCLCFELWSGEFLFEDSAVPHAPGDDYKDEFLPFVFRVASDAPLITVKQKALLGY